MSDVSNLHNGRCSCGEVVFEFHKPPLMRAYCHCTICQKFNQADYADVTIYYANSLGALDETAVEFKVHKQPPLLHRGICIKCPKPAIEKLNIPLFPKLFIVPSANITNSELLPEPAMHIIYDKRVADAGDSLAKYSGFLPSQIGFSMGLMKRMFAN